MKTPHEEFQHCLNFLGVDLRATDAAPKCCTVNLNVSLMNMNIFNKKRLNWNAIETLPKISKQPILYTVDIWKFSSVDLMSNN